MTAWKAMNLVAVSRLLLSVVADPEKEIVPSIDVGMACRLPASAVNSRAFTARVRGSFLFIGSIYLSYMLRMVLVVDEASQGLIKLFYFFSIAKLDQRGVGRHGV